VLRLGIDANELPPDDLICLFLWINQGSIELRKYADKFGGHLTSVAQGLVLFSQHSRAREFSAQIAIRCMHDSGFGGSRAVTHPWVVDLEDETITTCAGFWQLGRRFPLDAKGMLPRLVQKRQAA
jgi:hypothetical protein